jgi:hypothetical protein
MGVPAAEVDVWTPIGHRLAPLNHGPGGPWTGVLFHIAIPASNPDVIYVSSPTGGVWPPRIMALPDALIHPQTFASS